MECWPGQSHCSPQSLSLQGRAWTRARRGCPCRKIDTASLIHICLPTTWWNWHNLEKCSKRGWRRPASPPPPRGCIHHVCNPQEFLVGLIVPSLPHEVTVASDQVCNLPTTLALALVSVCPWWTFVVCAGKGSPSRESNDGVTDPAHNFLVAAFLWLHDRAVHWTDTGSSQMVIVEPDLVPAEDWVLPGGREYYLLTIDVHYHHLSFVFREVKWPDLGHTARIQNRAGGYMCCLALRFTHCKTFMILWQKQPWFQKCNFRFQRKAEMSLKEVLLACLSEDRAKSRVCADVMAWPFRKLSWVFYRFLTRNPSAIPSSSLSHPRSPRSSLVPFLRFLSRFSEWLQSSVLLN